jgi:hypothetical protein
MEPQKAKCDLKITTKPQTFEERVSQLLGIFGVEGKYTLDLGSAQQETTMSRQELVAIGAIVGGQELLYQRGNGHDRYFQGVVVGPKTPMGDSVFMYDYDKSQPASR